MTGTEPPRAGETSKPRPDDKHERADWSGQRQLEQEVGHELAHLLVAALSGGHGRFGSSSP